MVSMQDQVIELQNEVRRLTSMIAINQENHAKEIQTLTAKTQYLNEQGEQLRANVTTTPRGGKDGGKNFHEEKVLKKFTQTVFDKYRQAFPKWAKGIRIQLESHNFTYADECLTWAAAQKQKITMESFDAAIKDKLWTDADETEDYALNRTLVRYLELYTEGEAGGLVESATEGVDEKEKRNGAEVWRLICKRFAPKTAAQAMKIQKDAMKIGEAKDHHDI